MNNSLVKACLYSGVDGSAAIYHSGKLGMHWHIRNYQPYSQGYHSQSGGVFVGRTGGFFKKLFNKGKEVADYYKTSGLSDLKSGAKELAGKIKSNKVVSGYADAARQLADFGKSVGKKAGIKVSDAIGNLGDGFEVIKKEFGPDLHRTVGSLKTKASSATSSIGAAFLSMYLGGPKTSGLKPVSALYGTDKIGGRTLEPINQQTSKKSDTFYTSGFEQLSPIQQRGSKRSQLWPGYGFRSTNKSVGGRERATDRFTKQREQQTILDKDPVSPYNDLLKTASGYSTNPQHVSEAKKLLNQLTDMNGNMTYDSMRAQQMRRITSGGGIYPYTMPRIRSSKSSFGEYLNGYL